MTREPKKKPWEMEVLWRKGSSLNAHDRISIIEELEKVSRKYGDINFRRLSKAVYVTYKLDGEDSFSAHKEAAKLYKELQNKVSCRGLELHDFSVSDIHL